MKNARGKKKMGAGAASKAGLGETFEWKPSHALAVLLAQSKQDITRTDNDYTHSNILRRGLQVRFRYKELCTLYNVMSVGLCRTVQSQR